MQLEGYLRSHLKNKWSKFYIKDKCELCDSTEKLELHHKEQFIHMLDEILKMVNLPYKDTDDYTKDELKLIRLLMLGKHLEIKTQMLCGKCHDIQHEKIKYSELKKKKIRVNKENPKINIIINTIDKLIYDNEFIQEAINNKILKNNNYINKKEFRLYLGIKSKTTFRELLKNNSIIEYFKLNNIVDDMNSKHLKINK